MFSNVLFVLLRKAKIHLFDDTIIFHSASAVQLHEINERSISDVDAE